MHTLVEELVRAGHDVTMIAPPGSWCSGRTIEVAAYDPNRPWTRVRGEADLLSEEPLYEAIAEFTRTNRVDVIHDWSFQNYYVRRHPENYPFVVSTCIPPAPGFARSNLVACSRAHAELIAPTTRHVYYGLALADWSFNTKKTDQLVHIAKIARYKAQHLAILAARKTGRRLLLAGNVEDPLYDRAVIRPLVWLSRGVQYVGEIEGTADHLRDAAALVQTPRWFDAFPLVVLEALASATPVIALAAGGLPEQIVHGETGFLCNDLAELIEAFERLPEIRPENCRAYAEAHFSVERMGRDYLSLYERAGDGETW